MKILRGIFYFFDKFEDVVRGILAEHPFVYTFIGGTGVVLFWRGIWSTADVVENTGTLPALIFSPFGSIVLGVTILLATGLFVSVFVGDSIIMSGIKREKKVVDKTIDDVEEEKSDIQRTLDAVTEIKEEMRVLEGEIHNTHHKSEIK